MIGPPRGHRTMSWELACDRAAVAGARRLVRRTLTGWGLPHLSDEVILIVSELVTNAVAHGAPPIRLTLHAGAGVLRGEVIDHGPERPHRLDAAADACHGRGLMIVDALADHWGATPSPHPPGPPAQDAHRPGPGDPDSHPGSNSPDPHRLGPTGPDPTHPNPAGPSPSGKTVWFTRRLLDGERPVPSGEHPGPDERPARVSERFP
ncbi:ATP-binding protein [Sphaerisporangium perillae]|uniref:ATP-binding protein n=1 Tax=Sphaerisporangium perillae TaxID=2935860 RepID=UPI00200BE7CA|nr:ATP-binding protein [Sphaerisporangium perillae]